MAVFGAAVIAAEDLAKTLSTRVCTKVKNDNTDREWTRVVLEELRTLGRDEKHCVVSPDKRNDEGAFLLDLVWWKNAELNDIALAVESEWGSNKQVWHDFGKLLVIKAPLKLMIYGTSHHENEGAVVRDGITKDYMQKFTHHIKGEQYVLLEFAVADRMVYAYRFPVPTDGQLSAVIFDEILEARTKW